MARKSWLPPGGSNKFQVVKAKRREAEARGIPIINLGVGQPSGAPLLSAREAGARALLDGRECMHEYQDNSMLALPENEWARRFTQCHVRTALNGLSDVGYLPTPGTKPMLIQIPLACGAGFQQLTIAAMTDPGYPTPGDCAVNYLRQEVCPVRLDHLNGFRFTMDDVAAGCQVIMCNYPHNPSGQIATEEFWHSLCKVCAATGIRLFNDAAYAILAHSSDHCSLADVAVQYPELSWAEAYSASKAGNFTGWRIGCIVGSPDFVGDIATIKGNVDSGFNAALAMGVLEAFENDRAGIEEVRGLYEARITTVVPTLTDAGMQIAVQPGAGFFTLWQTPKRVFGQSISGAEEFCSIMIERVGLIGIPFGPYVRYAVCGNDADKIDAIAAAFAEARPSYIA